ncbi:MAG TPA: NADPH-dependent F420 reductase [Actinomycetes bacterium]|nr:NADPH-dependent F420 reductase [Actinomycetes bacterium]
MTSRVEELLEHPHTVSLAVVGGTGEQGRGLATRFAQIGHQVTIGSRDLARAKSAAESIRHAVDGSTNQVAVQSADVVVVAVPWAAHEETLHELRADLVGRVVIDCVNPLGFDSQGPFPLNVAEGSALQQAAMILPDSPVVGAFHHVSAVHLLDETLHTIDTDVMVIGDDRTATSLVIALVNRLEGMRGVYAGRVRNAHQVEALTANLIAINRRYKTNAGLRLTGL